MVELARVVSVDEENGRTRIRVDTSGTRLAATGLRLQGLSALVIPNLNPIAGQGAAERDGIPNDFRSRDRAASQPRRGVGFATVTGPRRSSLDAALRLARQLAAGAAGHRHRNLQRHTANPNVRIDAGTVPGPGTGVVVGTGANAFRPS